MINRLVKNVILEERKDKFNHENLALQYKMDNEFELIFVVGYQKFLTLSYVDKFLDEIQLAFRDKFNDFDLRTAVLKSTSLQRGAEQASGTDYSLLSLVDFNTDFTKIYAKCSKTSAPEKEMRSFEQSSKSQKTVASMIINPSKEKEKQLAAAAAAAKQVAPPPVKPSKDPKGPKSINGNGPRKRMMEPVSPKAKSDKGSKTTGGKKEKGKREWDLSGKNDPNLDFSRKDEGMNGGLENNGNNSSSVSKNVAAAAIPDMSGDIKIDTHLEYDSSDEEEVDVRKAAKGSFFGSLMKTLTHNRPLTKADLDPILNQLKDHLVAKNVASEIATKLCDSVCTKLEGQTVSGWMGLKNFVKASLEDSVLSILSPNRNINILREIKAKRTPPYVICFCGVNGVGKSTNLAKISNWLIQNGVRVLVIACDTFRAGAIEQLRTHVTALKNIHEKDGKTRIELYEKGYGKDSAAIAMEAINYARTAGFNCCLIDTAGRMQDNEPLMKQLAKLIKINEPDLTLFVGEALVGNEAVDQLTKFNTALVDHGCRGNNSSGFNSAINGIILTKFDTIDDQVGAAVSMTYITGQPIVFVGVGQTYRDLKQLNAKAVVQALMK